MSGIPSFREPVFEKMWARWCSDIGAAQLLSPFSVNPRRFWVSVHKNMLLWPCWMPAAAENEAFHISGNGKTKGFWCERPISAAAAASRTAPPLSPLITQHSTTVAYIQFHTVAKKNIFRWVIGYWTCLSQYAASHLITEQCGFVIIFSFLFAEHEW